MNVNGIYILKGDINCDQRITIEDIALLQASVLNLYDLSGDNEISADVNNDGTISTLDVLLVHKHNKGLKMITELVNK